MDMVAQFMCFPPHIHTCRRHRVARMETQRMLQGWLYPAGSGVRLVEVDNEPWSAVYLPVSLEVKITIPSDIVDHAASVLVAWLARVVSGPRFHRTETTGLMEPLARSEGKPCRSAPRAAVRSCSPTLQTRTQRIAELACPLPQHYKARIE